MAERELFNRDDADNPTRDWNYVYVPYCTGDLHAGSIVADYNGETTRHVGRTNIQHMLDQIAPNLSGAERVVLTGSSAGGYGSSLNYALVAETFSEARVDLINDGGPPLPTPEAPADLMQTWIAAWDLTAVAPPNCQGCDEDVSAYLTANFAAYPDARFSMLTFTEDGVLTQYYGVDGSTFASGLESLRVERFEPASNAHVFYKSGADHTLFGRLRSTEVDGVDAWSWVRQQLNDDPGWSDITP